MKQLFQTLGATEKETQIFLKLLELGAQPISIVARHLNMPRSSMYTYIEQLKDLELIEEFQRAGIKYVQCIPIKNLKNLIKNKEKTLHQGLEILKEKLPELEKLESTITITPKVNFFEGKDAVKKMYRKILQQKEFVSFSHPQLVKKISPDYFYLIPEELKKNKGKAKELLVACDEAKEYHQKYHSVRHEIKILPKDMIFYSNTIITRDTIYMVSYGENDLSGVEIMNTSLAQTQRKIFNKMWAKS